MASFLASLYEHIQNSLLILSCDLVIYSKIEYFIISDILGIKLHLIMIDCEIFSTFTKYWSVQIVFTLHVWDSLGTLIH